MHRRTSGRRSARHTNAPQRRGVQRRPGTHRGRGPRPGVVDAQTEWHGARPRRPGKIDLVVTLIAAIWFRGASDTYGDMMEMGVIDPTKVTRYALQSAASVAGLILTTDAMVAELPKKEEAPQMPPGGGGWTTKQICDPY